MSARLAPAGLFKKKSRLPVAASAYWSMATMIAWFLAASDWRFAALQVIIIRPIGGSERARGDIKPNREEIDEAEPHEHFGRDR